MTSPKPSFEDLLKQVMDNIELATEAEERGESSAAREHFILAAEMLEQLGYEPDWPTPARKE